MDDWFKVDKLREMEKEVLSGNEIGKFDNRNDFVSYQMLAEGYSTEEANIQSHNMSLSSADIFCETINRTLHDYAGRHGLYFNNNETYVADFGGGVRIPCK